MELNEEKSPRYTSYPSAISWQSALENNHFWRKTICDELNKAESLQLYFHVPFCKSLCYYCGCNRVISSNQNLMTSYTDAVLIELENYKKYFNNNQIKCCHFGGGTPSSLGVSNFSRILDSLSLSGETELSIEIDSRMMNEEFYTLFEKYYFNRFSIGVQCFSQRVQKSINRIQSFEQICKVFYTLNSFDKAKISLDIVYGLPNQTLDDLQSTIDKVVALSPSRMSLFSYTHRPDVIKNQRLVDRYDRCPDDEKVIFFNLAKKLLEKAGYVQIGMDHFAKPDDPLAIAYQKSQVGRSFMGYTDHQEGMTLGIGASAITSLLSGYIQNTKCHKTYAESVKKWGYSYEKGYLLDVKEFETRKMITSLMTYFEADITDLSKVIEKDELYEFFQRIDELRAKGIISFKNRAIKIQRVGREFVRAICHYIDPQRESHVTH